MNEQTTKQLKPPRSFLAMITYGGEFIGSMGIESYSGASEAQLARTVRETANVKGAGVVLYETPTHSVPCWVLEDFADPLTIRRVEKRK